MKKKEILEQLADIGDDEDILILIRAPHPNQKHLDVFVKPNRVSIFTNDTTYCGLDYFDETGYHPNLEKAIVIDNDQI